MTDIHTHVTTPGPSRGIPDAMQTDPNIYYLLGEISGNVRAILVAQAASDKKQSVLEQRVSALEHAQIKMIAAASAAATILGTGAKFFIDFLKG